MLSSLDKLRLFLRPPGRGIYTHSTGGGYAERVLTHLYGFESAQQIQGAWEDSLQRIRRAEAVVMGIPSDTGASILRGANFGPLGIRDAYLSQTRYPKNVLDLGDIICVPQLLHDEMLSESQRKATHEALFPGVAEPLPVSPLSIAEHALAALYDLNPATRVILLGGDHSISWPAILYCQRRCGNKFGILHFDAHTDMLEKRLGVKYCYATWAFHAQKLILPHHLVQVGIRTSQKTKEYWTQNFPIIQFWASEVNVDEDALIVKVLQHFRDCSITELYISNDIDGTDISEAPATGTPEAGGLSPRFVKRLLAAVRAEFKIIGGDIVEVAPPLGGTRDFASEKTCRLASEYLSLLLP